ncbi:MAG: GtrA family protein [Aquisalinus sp.]|nr:GtrA family protein [Aquisalinus sp.]
MTLTANITGETEASTHVPATPPLRGLLSSLGAFALVGIAATIVHYLVLMLLLKTGLVASLIAANLLGFAAALLVSYIGNHVYVFDGGRSHVQGFAIMVAGYLGVMAFHTTLMIGLTEGQIFAFLQGPAAPFGGAALLGLWYGVLDILPAWLSQHMAGDTPLTTSTTIAFLASSGSAAVLTYCWNRFIVFKPMASTER